MSRRHFRVTWLRVPTLTERSLVPSWWCRWRHHYVVTHQHQGRVLPAVWRVFPHWKQVNKYSAFEQDDIACIVNLYFQLHIPLCWYHLKPSRNLSVDCQTVRCWFVTLLNAPITPDEDHEDRTASWKFGWTQGGRGQKKKNVQFSNSHYVFTTSRPGSRCA